ncbi:MAG: DUF3422 domain-containing protein [Rhizobiaceae bacterium]|nr:DUF3422 domain-containing protein [Rhizobiaceae bacterium]
MATPDKPDNAWNFHGDHSDLVAETHARPSQPVSGPAEIFHLAIRCNEQTIEQFFSQLDAGSVRSGPRHWSGTLGPVKVKLEQHTEFTSLTLFHELEKQAEPETVPGLLKERFPMEAVEILVLIRLTIASSAPAMLKSLAGGHRIYGGKIRNRIDMRSSFVPDETGMIHFAVYGKDQTPEELGRRIQRLLEMETYRTMSLLGLPVARRVGAQISACETRLSELTRQLRQGAGGSQTEDEALFRELTGLSEQNNILLTETRYRFAASRAYFTLFRQRIESLEEEKVGDVQTMSGFLRSRIEPAMATIESTSKRQETLNDDLSRAIALLRTRIELNLNKGNQNLLKSMDRRHDQQLKISQTVEGLSIIAITYYAVGLASYFLKALAAQDWVPFSEKLLTAASVPVIFLMVFVGLRKLRKAWEERTP